MRGPYQEASCRGALLGSAMSPSLLYAEGRCIMVHSTFPVQVCVAPPYLFPVPNCSNIPAIVYQTGIYNFRQGGILLS